MQWQKGYEMGDYLKRLKSITEDKANGLSIFSGTVGFGPDKWLVCSIDWSKLTTTTVDYTATSSDNCCRYVVATNAGGAVNAIFKGYQGQELVIINSSGYTLTVKTATQAGVAVLNGTVVILYGTGTNFATVTTTTSTISGATINNTVIGGVTPAAGHFTTLDVTGATALSPTGSVTINPSTTLGIAPTGAMTINPTAASTMNNVAIGGSTPLAGAFTTVDATTSIKLKGSSTGKAVIATANSSGSDYTATLPAATDTIALIAAAQTLTNKTITGAIVSDWSRCSSQQDATSNITLANITGLVTTVVPGTYAFVVNLPGTATANGGIKVAFKLTTAVLTSIEATGKGFTATGLVTQHTTTTADQTLLLDSQTAIIDTVIRGSCVVGTGGTIQMQMAQHASHADTSSVYIGATMQFTRIA